MKSSGGSSYFDITRKDFQSNLVLVVVLVLESKGLRKRETRKYNGRKLDPNLFSRPAIFSCAFHFRVFLAI